MYVDGPELDGNFVLGNGQILFLQGMDHFPWMGDLGNTMLFAETVLVSNGLLPAGEVDIIHSPLHQSLVKLGFRSCVYHAEASMHNSSMKYQDRGDSVVDLVIRSTAWMQQPPQIARHKSS